MAFDKYLDTREWMHHLTPIASMIIVYFTSHLWIVDLIEWSPTTYFNFTS